MVGIFTVRVARTDARGNTTTRDHAGFTKKGAMAFMRSLFLTSESKFEKARIDRFGQLYVIAAPSK